MIMSFNVSIFDLKRIEKERASASKVTMSFVPRDCRLIAFAKQAVARKCVLLAEGEKNDIPLITRSVINHYMREQASATVVQNIRRAFELLFEEASPAGLFLSTRVDSNQLTAKT